MFDGVDVQPLQSWVEKQSHQRLRLGMTFLLHLPERKAWDCGGGWAWLNGDRMQAQWCCWEAHRSSSCVPPQHRWCLDHSGLEAAARAGAGVGAGAGDDRGEGDGNDADACVPEQQPDD